MATLSLWLIQFQNLINKNMYVYYLQWELTAPYGNQQYVFDFNHFTAVLQRHLSKILKVLLFLMQIFSFFFCLGLCSLFYNYPSQTLLERVRTMFSGYFTNYPIFHHVRKSPGGSTYGYHTPHLPHSLKMIMYTLQGWEINCSVRQSYRQCI